MRITVNFVSDNPVFLPFSLNEIVQGFIYWNMEESLAKKIHDSGFLWEKRSFKLFTFSRIRGSYEKHGGGFCFRPPFGLVISSPKIEILESLAEHLFKAGQVRLGDNMVRVESVNVHARQEFKTQALIKMLSPMTAYSTLQTMDGKPKVYYYSPHESEFAELIKKNLMKKYEVLKELDGSSLELAVEPVGVKKQDEIMVRFKGGWVKGWMGKYRLIGSPELIEVGYDAGLGSKNSQGFGCFEIVNQMGRNN